MKFSTRFFVVLLSALVLIAMSAGAGNDSVKYDAIEKGPTAAESAPMNSAAPAEAEGNSKLVINDSIVGLIKVAATQAIVSYDVRPVSTKMVDSGYQITPGKDRWGYALVKGPATIHSLGEENLWHKIEIPANEWFILLSWGRQFTIESTDNAIVVASTMTQKTNVELLKSWADVLGGNSITWKYYELRENGNFLETRLGGW